MEYFANRYSENGRSHNWAAASRSLAVIALAIGTAALAGWIFELEPLKRIHSSLVTMKANTAIGLMLASIALLLLQNPSVTGHRRLLARCFAAVIGLLGVISLSEHLFGWDLGIDQLLFVESAAEAGLSFPGRMGVAACLVFIFLGMALLFLDTRSAGNHWTTICSSAALTLTFLVFLYYFYGVEQFEPIAIYATIALHTVVAFLCLSVGILLARPDQGLARVLLAPTVGSLVARRMFPAAIFLPVLLGWLRTLGRKAGLFSPGFGTAALVLMMILAFTGLIWWTVRAIDRQESERKLAETGLRESEERFRTLAENIPQLAWMADERGLTLWYNQRWYDYTGASFPQMQGWGWKHVHHPDHLERVLLKWKSALANGEPWEDVFPLRGKNGLYQWFLSRAFPIRNAAGSITRWFGTNTDITELRQTQEALQQAQTKLQEHADSLQKAVAERTHELRQTIGELEAFSYSLSHDMRAPLRAIRNFTEIVLCDFAGQIDSKAAGYLNKVLSSAGRLDRLIQDLLSYTKISRQEFPVEKIEMEALLHQIVAERPELQAPAAQVSIESPLLPMLGHEASLTQCVTNLLGNAVKFVPAGVLPRVRVWTEARGHNVRLFVQDNGIGIGQHEHHRLFGMFQRLENAVGKYEGTGMGLAIVRKAMERMAGQVGLDSVPGKGSTFWIELKGTGNA